MFHKEPPRDSYINEPPAVIEHSEVSAYADYHSSLPVSDKKTHIIREGKLNADMDPYNLAMSAKSVPTNRTLQRPLKSREQKKITKYFLTVSVYSDCTLDSVNTKPSLWYQFFISVFEAIGTTHHKVIEQDR